MLERLQTGLPLELFHGQTYQTAVVELETKFPGELKKQKAAASAHGTITLEVKKSVESKVAPELRFHGTYKDGAEIFVVKIGRRLFPMIVNRFDWDRTAIELYPPRGTQELDFG